MLSIPFRKLSITDLFSKIANFSASFASFCKRSLAFASTHAILPKTHFSLLKTPEGELRNDEIGGNCMTDAIQPNIDFRFVSSYEYYYVIAKGRRKHVHTEELF